MLSVTSPTITYAANGLPIIHSRPDAPVTIFIDFQYESRDGQKLTFDWDGDPSTFFDAREQQDIIHGWAKTASSYAPFDVNVTTEFPDADTPFIWAAVYRLPTGPGSGGGARTFRYMDLAGYQANRYSASGGRVEDGLLAQSWIRQGAIRTHVITHETGHSHGVSGHETTDTEGNRQGIQTLPIERGPFTRSVGPIGGWYDFTTEWAYQSNPAGMYFTNDDMQIISDAIIDGIQTYVDPSYSGDGFAPDDHADSRSAATPMTPVGGGVSYGEGVIERWDDRDMLSFNWTGGDAWIGVETSVPSLLLDVRFKVYDSAGNVQGVADPHESRQAALRLDDLAAGEYYIELTSDGDYSELGAYAVTVGSDIPDSLKAIAHLELNNYSLADSSGQGHNGTWSGSSSWTTSRDGSTAIRLTGNNRVRVQAPSGNFSESGIAPLGRTFGLWFKADNVNAGKQVIFEDPTSPGYQIYIENGRLKALATNPGGLSNWTGTEVLDSGISLSSGQWYHVALTHWTTFSVVQDTLALYLNGDEVARGDGGPVPATNQFYVGSTSFRGAIDDVYIFNEVVEPHMIAEWADRGDLSAAAPTGPAMAVTGEVAHDSVELDWAAVDGATGYQVWRSVDHQHFQLIATLSSAATSFMDTDLRGSTQYAYAINTLGAADVGRFDALTRSGPVDFLQYVKVKRETAAPDLQWVNKADLWGHNAEGLYGISLNFFGPDGHRDTDLRIDISTDGINYTPLITLPRNEMVYYANNLAQGQYYSFKLTPIDDFGAVDGAARTIEVDSLNFHPVANDDDVVSTTTPVVISPLANDSDWDGDTLTITAFTQGDHGTVTQVGNQLTYNPTSGNFTPDEFTYTVSDGFGGEATGTVRVTITQQGSLGIFTSNRDIGSPARAGSSFESGGVYTVIGGGTDIWQTSDQFQYVYRDMSGDVEIIARIDYLEDVHEWSKGGLMIRNGTGANAAHAMVQIRPDGNASFQWRDAAGASAGYGGVTGGTSMPKWLRLVRSGNTFRAYYSFDGANWTQISSSRNINMANSVQVGLAVTSHDNGELATAQFSNVSIPSLPTLAGDYNLDGVVDTDDYMVWRNNFGQTGTNPADGNNNGIVDSADYTIWRDNLGATLAPPAAEETLQPEQTTSNPTAQPEGDVETDSANEHAVVSSTDSEQEQAKPTRCELLQDRQKRREARQERTSVRVLERIRKQTVRQASVLDEQSAAVAMLWWNRLQDADDDDRKRLRKR